jgi:hypothetical protein
MGSGIGKIIEDKPWQWEKILRKSSLYPWGMLYCAVRQNLG